MTKKHFFITTMTLTILFVSFCFGLNVQAETWDIELSITDGIDSWQYRLSENIDNLSQHQIESKAIYRSLRAKRAVVDKVMAQGYCIEQALCYVLPNFDDILANIRTITELSPTNAKIILRNGKFFYTPDCNGTKLDASKLCREILHKGSGKYSTPINKVKADLTLAQAKNQTTYRGGFYTFYNPNSFDRSHNIAQALANFDGLVVAPNQKVSFNTLTGERTIANGYREAKIILNGKYVDGVGGGVCQASTTLYNALLLADVRVDMRCRHSLVSSYVDAGFDAMVNNNTADLIFTNTTNGNLYFSTSCNNGVARVNIYGIPNQYRIERSSQVVERIPPRTVVKVDKEGQYQNRVKYTDESFVLTHGSDKLTTNSYLYLYDGDKLIEKRFLRQDTYQASDRIIVKGAIERLSENVG